ncbi:hypothetical protein LR48_Vigan08g134600 [Vigna angularis]|uniref:Uncharacterized protein n=1 Tax=Phaseolus angularis TaxID=3914 RepID=A0A0L9V793_PHAAN|nr:hypothetical protein LR48_Vigan08g134600 [Vigna angularis]
MIPINESLIYEFRKMGGGLTKFVLVMIISIGMHLLDGEFVIWLCVLIPKHAIGIPIMGGVTVFVMIGIANFETTLPVPVGGTSRVVSIFAIPILTALSFPLPSILNPLYPIKRSAEGLKKQNQKLERKINIIRLEEQMNKLLAFSRNLSKAERDVRKERDALVNKVQIQDAQIVEMQTAIYNQHTRGFEKALRQIPCRNAKGLLNVSIEGTGFDIMKDMYKGELIPLKDIPNDEPEAELTMEPTEDVATEEGNEGVDVIVNPEIMNPSPNKVEGAVKGEINIIE